jgi:hypothetical protein
MLFEIILAAIAGIGLGIITGLYDADSQKWLNSL